MKDGEAVPLQRNLLVQLFGISFTVSSCFPHSIMCLQVVWESCLSKSPKRRTMTQTMKRRRKKRKRTRTVIQERKTNNHQHPRPFVHSSRSQLHHRSQYQTLMTLSLVCIILPIIYGFLYAVEYESDELFEDKPATSSPSKRSASSQPPGSKPPPSKKAKVVDEEESVTEPQSEELDWLDGNGPTTAAATGKGASLIHSLS